MNECYVCDTKEWYTYRDQLYYFDQYIIEKFYNIFGHSCDTLEDLIHLITHFRGMCNNIKHSITETHQIRCACSCEKCGQYIPGSDKTKPIPQIECLWDDAYLYYSGLTHEQYETLSRLNNCYDEIGAINSMVGMDSIKEEFLKLLKFLSTNNGADNFMMHMMITGPPGHGKTHIAKLLGRAFQKSGLLKSDKFVAPTRANLIGAYCGHTAKETTKQFDKAQGGVIFIDEVYALGNKEKRDVFTKECIDTINQLLTERNDTLCIIAGYEHEIQECFFAYNMGLARRFPWHFKINPYTEQDLIDIFIKKMSEQGWTVEPNALREKDIKDNKEHFVNAGGDIENLVSRCILSHYSNSFLHGVTKVITRQDVKTGLDDYVSGHQVNESTPPPPPPPHGMYI